MSMILFRDPSNPILPPSENDSLPEDFEIWRASLDGLNGQVLLNTLIEPENTALYLQNLPTEDVHYFIHKIGLEDSELILSQLSNQQIQEMLDMEIWQGDEINLKKVDEWLLAIMRANHEKIMERMLALDESTLMWIVKKMLMLMP